jgi:DNA-binding response OmpR family regulator
MKVLVVEDSEKLQRAVAFALRKAQFAVDKTRDGEEGLWLAGENDYDAIVLDLMLPSLDGLTVLQRLRKAGRDTPVLLLTVKSAVEDRVNGLRAGADDYLAKPFAMDELLARIEALVRRKYGARSPTLRVGLLEVNTSARLAMVADQVLDLQPREYRVLEFLARRMGEVVTRTEIEEHIYGDEAAVFSNAVESTISMLRRKLDAAGAGPLIHTRRGLGYVLDPAAA